MPLKMILLDKWNAKSQNLLNSHIKYVHMILILALIDQFASNVSREPKIDAHPKALRKTGFSELFVFASFGNVWFLKFGNFTEKPKIKNPKFSNTRKFPEKSTEKSSVI
jgi:hypothetical protein